jgi:hypothetical protein
VNQQLSFESVRDLGYQLLPRTHRDSPGGSGLVVALRKEPTGKHFDPKAIRVRLRDVHGVAKQRSLSLLSQAPDSDRVCPGRVILTDRMDKRVEFFTFGGSLQVISAPDAQVYALRSSAPFSNWSPKRRQSPTC